MAGVVGAINLTPPVVVSGNPHHVSGNTKEKVVSQSFTTDGVTFFVEVHYIL
jgi:CheY-specific phosphatase CheX